MKHYMVEFHFSGTDDDGAERILFEKLDRQTNQLGITVKHEFSMENYGVVYKRISANKTAEELNALLRFNEDRNGVQVAVWCNSIKEIV